MDGRRVHPSGNAGFERKTIIRARRQDDIEACVRILADVHAADGYPMFWPADPPTWLAPDSVLAAWVAAQHEHTVIGHVALCGAGGDAAAPLWCAASGLPAEHLAVVAKLFVAPSARGQGVGAGLLTTACAEARLRGLRPALEVLDHDRGAIALYERMGWRHVASVPPARWTLASEGRPTLHYYIAPN